MNIFVLDLDPGVAATYHCDLHLETQIQSGIQMLRTAAMFYGNNIPSHPLYDTYPEVRPEHPCVKWVTAGLLNYQWLWKLTYFLAEEVQYRFGRVHPAKELLNCDNIPLHLEKYPKPPTRTPFANVTADWLRSSENWDKPASFTTLTGVDVYRLHYIVDERKHTDVWFEELNHHYTEAHESRELEWDRYSIWTKRGEPPFMSERFYRQMCDHFGIKSADLLNMERHPESPEAEKTRAKIERKIGARAKTPKASTGEPKRKVTKADYMGEIYEILGINKGLEELTKLTLDDLLRIKMFLPSLVGVEVSVEMPTGRLKKPFIDAVSSIITCEVDWGKLTVAGLKQVIELFI